MITDISFTVKLSLRSRFGVAILIEKKDNIGNPLQVIPPGALWEDITIMTSLIEINHSLIEVNQWLANQWLKGALNNRDKTIN